jgi:hypothetical protein
MKVITSATWKSMNDFIAGLPADTETSYEYEGPIARLDRAAQSAAKSAANTAAQQAASESGQAAAERAQLAPFFAEEMGAQHGFTPGQVNELLTNALSGAGAATGATQGAMQRQAAQTRNVTGLTKGLQDVAMERAKAAAGGAEGVAAQDVLGAQQLRQEGAKGMAGLYGQDTDAMLKSMGLQTQDIQTQIEAGKSGWLQNTEGMIKALTGAGASALKAA